MKCEDSPLPGFHLLGSTCKWSEDDFCILMKIDKHYLTVESQRQFLMILLKYKDLWYYCCCLHRGIEQQIFHGFDQFHKFNVQVFFLPLQCYKPYGDKLYNEPTHTPPFFKLSSWHWNEWHKLPDMEQRIKPHCNPRIVF